MASKKLHFLLVFLFLLPHFPEVTSQTEPQILLQIKKDFGNPDSLSSWIDSTSHCSWLGISCTGTSVTSVLLSGNNLTSSVPTSLCQLPNLTHLDLSFNFLRGHFPTSLYNCTHLRHLDLSQNLFVGSIPADINLLSPSKLEFLSLSANNFSGDIPPSVGKLESIVELLLDNNLFNGTIPAELGNLSTLQTLWLANNPFAPAEIPSSFGNMTSLSFLWMTSTNVFGEIPDSFGKLENLMHLDLAMNRLAGRIPTAIWMLDKLQIVYLYHNKLVGDISGKFGTRSLVSVDLSMNALTGMIPEFFGKQVNLTVLNLYYNNLSGTIPASIGVLPALSDIRLFNNRLTGALPSELGKNSPLWNLEVDDNELSGELPESLCAGGILTSIVVSNNKFTGRIPESLGNCSSLNNVQIQRNRFSGEVPAGIWTSAVNLTTVMMGHNSLSGELPERLPWNLTRLEMDSNRFSGSIPSSAPSLLVFVAGNNSLSGTIPENLVGISKLQVLSLGNNRISGEIPASISVLTSLTDLDLSGNRLSGELPESIGSLPVLTTLDLSENRLSGNIPAEIGNLKLNRLNLSSNSLDGEVPVPFQNQAYDQSFLSNPNLCSSNSLVNLRACGRRRSARSDKLSRGLLAVFIILGSLCFLGALALGLFMLREYRRRRDGSVLKAWKVTSFHKVDVLESNIVRGLTDDNLIGTGGAGMVYRVQVAGDTAVAVKKIWNSRKLDDKLEKEFLAEVEILGSIRHANIVKLYSCISNSKSKLLVYEYMENGSLDQWLHSSRRVDGRGTLDWPARLRIAIGAARGLCYMHYDCSPPIVHRDVKSSNILLDSEFTAKIADFGLARMLVKAGEAESVSAIAGSFGYMAPECGWLRKVNDKVDVYSFGVVLLELTTGREANGGGNEHGSLADSVWRYFQEGGGGQVSDLVDKEIQDPVHTEAIEIALKLGVICTSAAPTNRPSMKDVLQVLQRCNERNGRDGVEITGFGEYDGAPLLGTKWGSRRRKSLTDTDTNTDAGAKSDHVILLQ
ncbi:receptor-like protein kinase HSL1 [Iris pallida]|uniref:Receptor-like protein kinase HSL1 n=1 Tax=Iris pallida TaxID=29817 RepID=A0AAX6HE37_IRIPA|nr:receptor-like protein kinase HSL1 [Iris pallida]